MEKQFGPCKVTTVTGDITYQPDIDAIVNAANSHLQGGHGVCGAIFKAAGWPLMAEACQEHPRVGDSLVRCPTGEARVTEAFMLPNRAVIHAVGPIYNPDPLWDTANSDQLTGAYQSSLQICRGHGYKSICFPAISCGIYKYPLEDAATIAMWSVASWFKDRPDSEIEEVRFVFLAGMDGPELKKAFEWALAREDES